MKKNFCFIVKCDFNAYDYGSTSYLAHTYPVTTEVVNPVANKLTTLFHLPLLTYGAIVKLLSAAIILVCYFFLLPTPLLQELGCLAFIGVLLISTVNNSYCLLRVKLP